MTALADIDDVVLALGRALTSDEVVFVNHRLAQASDLVVGYLGRTPDPVPGPVARVVADMVAAVFLKPAVTVADYDASGYSTAREVASVRVGVESPTTQGPWLTKALRARLRPWRRGMFSIRTVPNSEEVEEGS